MTDLAALTTAELVRLSELERVIDAGKQTFLEVGNALLAIREEKLYRPLTFDAYCEQRWGFTDRRARQLMTSAVIGKRFPVLPTDVHMRIVDGLPEEHQNKVAQLIANKSQRQAEVLAREYREKNGVGKTFNRHPRLIALAEELGGLEGRWNEEMCHDLTPPEARKQLRRIETAIRLLEQARVAVEYRAATMHTWIGR